jgi:hypothetical protein
MLIVLVFGSVTILAQSARRGETPEKKEKATVTRSVTKENTTRKAHSAQPARTVQKQEFQKQRPSKPVSISTSNNPRSTYRQPETKVYAERNRNTDVKPNKFSTERYYSGNHYHNAYPTRKVKFHYHPDTYLHNFHVLYYPVYRDIYWSRAMYRDYHRWYPNYMWRYNYGYRIQTISAFDAKYNMGELAMVYGRVYATWFNRDTDDYLLFFGGDYPYQEFTIVIPAHVARRFSWRPERYFLGEHVTVTGLITTFNGIPEIVVKNKRQINIY